MENLKIKRTKKYYDIVEFMGGKRGLLTCCKKFDNLQQVVSKTKKEQEYQKVNKSY